VQPVALVGKNVYTLGPTTAGVKLYAISSRGMTFIPFEFSREEVEQAIKGRPLWAVFRGTHIPEMTMVVGEKGMVIPRDVQMDMLSEDSDEQWRKEVVRQKKQIDQAANIVVYCLYTVTLIVGFLLARAALRYLGLIG
jgi:hypothetical protein